MRNAIGVFLVLGVLGACGATSVGSMDPVEGGTCSKNGATATAADGCTPCTCAAKVWKCQPDACEATTGGDGQTPASGGEAATSNGAAPAGGEVSASGGVVGVPAGGSSGGITGTDPNPVVVVGHCARTVPAPPEPPPTNASKRPCDIYAEDGGPCVAAHSTVRALYATYDGPLYQLRSADNTTRDIGPTVAGGFADAAAHDAFCASTTCTISVIYDQSGQGNHLTKAPPGGAKTTPGNEALAAAAPAAVGSKKVYGVHIVPGVGYRNNDACGTAMGDDAETIYMVAAGDVYNGGCCFDYGNMERNSRDNGEGTAEAVYFGSTTIWGKGAGSGPWVMGDLENGLWAGNVTPYASNLPIDHKYVTAMLKGDGPGKNHWTIKSGDAQGGTLIMPFDGARPSVRYNPMRKEGGVGLGTAGDNSNAGMGNFFEGVMTAHYSSNEADDAVQANIGSVYGAR